MNCSRGACQLPLDGPHMAIWNEPSTGNPRLYCMSCGRRIMDGNQHDELKLKHEIRPAPESEADRAWRQRRDDMIAYTQCGG